MVFNIKCPLFCKTEKYDIEKCLKIGEGRCLLDYKDYKDFRDDNDLYLPARNSRDYKERINISCVRCIDQWAEYRVRDKKRGLIEYLCRDCKTQDRNLRYLKVKE